jgi:hypothetical protein
MLLLLLLLLLAWRRGVAAPVHLLLLLHLQLLL